VALTENDSPDLSPTEAPAPARVAHPLAPAAYPSLAELPTQLGPMGIRFDFNQGARILLPARGPDEPPWECRIRDLDTGNTIFQNANRGAFVRSAKLYYVRFGLEVSLQGEPVFTHDYDAREREVLVQLPVGTLGDTLAWFPYVEKFRLAHGCRLTVAMSPFIIPLLAENYPEIACLTHAEVEARQSRESVYATYSLGLFFHDKANIHQPVDFRHVGLHRTAAHILGVDPGESPARITPEAGGRPLAEPYVCIAVQASSGCKMWQNPNGWREVVSHLKARGYRVVCIDQRPVHGSNLVFTHIPHGVDDETGDRPLMERARWLAHAEAFVGLASGLSWLAWSAGAPVVMISGFSLPDTEFATPYRVINWHACNGCWNDPAEQFQHDDFLWCPRHKGTPRHFECTRLITSHHVITQIDRALAARSD
jgi:autotransporter strand-loop-strand O-heptosyltransferase